MLLTSNCCIRLKYKSSIHNIASSSEVISSESGEKYAQIDHKQKQLVLLVDFDVRRQQGRTFPLEEVLL